MERSCGLSFGFGGKLATVIHTERPVADAATGAAVKVKESKISIRQMAVEAESVPQTESFDAAVRSQDRDLLADYCMTKQKTLNGEEKETWEVLGFMFSPDAKRQLLVHLGFDEIELPQPQPVVENGGGSEEPPPPFPSAHQDSGVHAALDFFENLPDEVVSPKAEAKPVETKVKKQETTPGVNEDDIQKALLVRNYEAAVESCFNGNREADALIIAHVAGPAFFERVMNRYLGFFPFFDRVSLPCLDTWIRIPNHSCLSCLPLLHMILTSSFNREVLPSGKKHWRCWWLMLMTVTCGVHCVMPLDCASTKKAICMLHPSVSSVPETSRRQWGFGPLEVEALWQRCKKSFRRHLYWHLLSLSNPPVIPFARSFIVMLRSLLHKETSRWRWSIWTWFRESLLRIFRF